MMNSMTIISARTREWTPHQLMRQLQAVGVPAGVVQTAEDLWRDVQLRARNYTVMMAHPELGMVEHPGMTVRLHATPGANPTPCGTTGRSERGRLSRPAWGCRQRKSHGLPRPGSSRRASSTDK